MFENLSERLERSFKILKGEGKITEVNVAETLKDVRRALLDADVNYKVAKTFTDTVKEKALGQDVLTSVRPSQLMVKIVHDELAALMGGDAVELQLKGRPAVILMSGLQGSGKTTMSGKLALMLKNKKHRRPLLVACDVYRPAAIKQLEVVGAQLDIPVFSMGDSVSPVEIAKAAVAHAIKHGNDMVFLDTAGRLHVDEELMAELSNIKAVADPTEILLVVDAMLGQDAVNVAESFNNLLDITGVVLTKMDGDTRGGAALSVRHVTGKPIKFVGTGEKLDAIEPFHPDRMASRILGMGDVLSLIEKAQEAFDEKKAEEMERKLRESTFDLNDFLEQFRQVKDMGSIEQLVGMIPGMKPGALKDAQIDEKALGRTEAIILAMTPKERQKPDIINASRKKRIAAGSGTSVVEVNKLLRQFEQMSKMFKQLGGMTGKGKRRKMKMPFSF